MTILTETFEGVPGGMNLAQPAQELEDTQARYLQDILLDFPGLTRRRGPVQDIPGMVSFTAKASGFLQTLDPVGQIRLAVLTGDNASGNLEVISDDLSSKTALPWSMNLPCNPPSQPYSIVDAKPSLTGGVMIGTSSRYDSAAPSQALAFWRGGNKANYTTGTITVARGSAAVTGAGTTFVGNVVPGMFLFANTDDPYTNAYIGVVLAVIDNTHLTLGQVSPHPITAKSFTLTSLRGINPRVIKGRITSDTTSAIVSGGQTKFIDQGLGTGTWQIYRASDYAYVGKVTSVQTNTSLTLTANAAVSMANERYVAWRVDGDSSLNTMSDSRKPGFLTTVYAERQFYANNGQALDKTSRVWFSDPSDPEGLDLSAFDGDFINIGSSRGANQPIQSLQTAYNALLIHKEAETYALYGNSPTTFNVKKLTDDGTLSGMSVQPWSGGVIWAGRNGIHFYDGIQAENIVQDKLGDYWKSSIRSFNPATWRMYSAIVRDHYVLFIENLAPTVGVVKGTASTIPTRLTVVINMPTRAVTMFTNVNVRGAIQLPASTGQTVYYIVNDATKAHICNASDLFDQQAVDTIACDGGTLGPDFYFESKKFSAGDSLRKKLFKQLAMHYLVQGGDLKIDTVTGLNNIGKTSNTVFPATTLTWAQLGLLVGSWSLLPALYPTWSDLMTSVFKPKRIKFLKRSQHLAFKVYQSSSAITRVQLGPFQIGYKLQRPGRV